MDTIDQRLEALRNRPTSYEIALVATNGDRYRIGYSVQRTKKAAFHIFAQALPKFAHLLDDDDGNWDRKQMAFVAPNWKFGFFTGRTKRDAIIEGELPTV